MSDTFTAEEIEEIIQDNQDLSLERQEYFQVDRQMLKSIFDKINTCNTVTELRQRIIRRASYIISLIPNKQPFREFNRHSAYATAMDFLRRNNLNLPLSTVDEERAFFNVMDRTKDKNEDDPTLSTDVENYLTSRVVDSLERIGGKCSTIKCSYQARIFISYSF